MTSAPRDRVHPGGTAGIGNGPGKVAYAAHPGPPFFYSNVGPSSGGGMLLRRFPTRDLR